MSKKEDLKARNCAYLTYLPEVNFGNMVRGIAAIILRAI